MRDWLSTLWYASFKGVPFWVETDEEEGSRRVVIHQFPNRDDPFLEDLGEGPRRFSIDAYVAGDLADLQASGLGSQLTTLGPGVLVLPAHGPLFVRCVEWSRNRSKDQHGKVAFTAKFIREGSSFGLSSVSSIANAVFGVVSALASVAATTASRRILVRSQPEYVIDDTISAFEEGYTQLELLRKEAKVDSLLGPRIALDAQNYFRALPETVKRSDEIPVETFTTAIELTQSYSEAMRPETAVRLFGGLLENPLPSLKPVYRTENEITAALNAYEVKSFFRCAWLTAYANAVTKATFESVREGRTVRADVAEFFEHSMEALTGHETYDLYIALANTRGKLIEYLNAAVIDLASVLNIEANRSIPSLVWAWRLYQDPTRANELVSRNKVIHPSFMPVKFEALSR